ncbi:hypothetical protein ACFV0D_01485 [Streptomyces sp. NPDC059556]|uniref:hypothetical protein n=1 Tax=Streptomyces sp. NPDC059556 TaxID=3346863 RepID=UPI0036CF494B
MSRPAGAVAVWFRRWWSVTGRVLFTATAAGACAMSSMLVPYRLVGGPFAWPAG